MALNLLRNSRVFFTSKVDSTTGVVPTSGFATSDTQEIAVLEGFSFSQNTNNDTITISEAGATPTRGQRTFNTSLAPVDFSFSTYIRPYRSTNVKCEESVLWNALAGSIAKNTALTGGTFTAVTYTTATNTLTITGTSLTSLSLSDGDDVVINGIGGTATAAELKVVNGPARVSGTPSATSITLKLHNPGTADIATTNLTFTAMSLYKCAWSEAAGQAILSMIDSNRNQLQKFGLVVIVDSVTYVIDNCAMGQVMIDFGLDGIATAQWTGQATGIKQLDSTVTTATAGTFGGAFSGNYGQKDTTTSNYITNKLSTATLKTTKALGTAATAGTPYYVAITGGSVTINNNINYVTPAILGVVNTPAAYFTGTRAVTGTLNAYLNTGTVTGYTGGGTGNLLKNMLAAASSVTEPMFSLELAIGGKDNALRVELQMPSVSLGVPTIDAQAVISTAINFTAAPSSLTGDATTSSYDLSRTNELTVRYYTT